LTDPARLEIVPAPWRDWAPRNPNGNGLPFLRSLMFLGWLEGLATGYRSVHNEGVYFGVGQVKQGTTCWFGHHTWRVTGADGVALGDRLWSTFLETGGPSPTEFRLLAAVAGTGFVLSSDTVLSFRRRGLKTEQLWELDRFRTRAPSR
jgi:hypothetical protein